MGSKDQGTVAASNIVRVEAMVVIITVPEYIFAIATIRLVVVDKLIIDHIINHIEDMLEFIGWGSSVAKLVTKPKMLAVPTVVRTFMRFYGVPSLFAINLATSEQLDPSSNLNCQ